MYHTESDRTLVQAVSVQVRGMILQKLGKIIFKMKVRRMTLTALYFNTFFTALFQACGLRRQS